MLIPYIEMKIEDALGKIPISKIVVGPTPHKDLSVRSVKAFMNSRGLKCMVTDSEIPYRNW
jgi:hypothetical protein